jgi:hypothetical protein
VSGPRIAIPIPGQDAQCEDCGLTYRLDDDGEPRTAKPYTCDDCGGAVEPVTNGYGDGPEGEAHITDLSEDGVDPGADGRRTEIVELAEDDAGETGDIYLTRVRYTGDEHDTIEFEGVGQLRCLTTDQATRLHSALGRLLGAPDDATAGAS